MNPDQLNAEQDTIKSKSAGLAKELVRVFPQVVDNKPVYLLVGSFAIKLALQADRIEILDVRNAADGPEIRVVMDMTGEGEVLHGAMTVPMDIDYIRANEGFYDRQNITSWDKSVFSHAPTQMFRDWRIFGGKEYLIEQFQSQEGVFASTHPMYKSWARVWIKGQSFLIINPLYAAALRNVRELAGEKDKKVTSEYIDALRKRFPDLYKKPV